MNRKHYRSSISHEVLLDQPDRLIRCGFWSLAFTAPANFSPGASRRPLEKLVNLHLRWGKA